MQYAFFSWWIIHAICLMLIKALHYNSRKNEKKRSKIGFNFDCDGWKTGYHSPISLRNILSHPIHFGLHSHACNRYLIVLAIILIMLPIFYHGFHHILQICVCVCVYWWIYMCIVKHAWVQKYIYIYINVEKHKLYIHSLEKKTEYYWLVNNVPLL